MTAPPDLSALVAAVERAKTVLEYKAIDYRRESHPLAGQIAIDAALLSRLAEALKGAEVLWHHKEGYRAMLAAAPGGEERNIEATKNSGLPDGGICV